MKIKTTLLLLALISLVACNDLSEELTISDDNSKKIKTLDVVDKCSGTIDIGTTSTSKEPTYLFIYKDNKFDSTYYPVFNPEENTDSLSFQLNKQDYCGHNMVFMSGHVLNPVKVPFKEWNLDILHPNHSEESSKLIGGFQGWHKLTIKIEQQGTSKVILNISGNYDVPIEPANGTHVYTLFFFVAPETYSGITFRTKGTSYRTRILDFQLLNFVKIKRLKQVQL